MNDAIMVLSGVAGFALLMIYLIAPIELDCSYNPLTWRSERRRRVEDARVRRISDLEHELGYRPCSNDECFSCKKIITMPDGSLHTIRPSVDEIVKMVYDNQIHIPVGKIKK